MKNALRIFLTWLLAKLGLLGKGLLKPQAILLDPKDPQYRPVVNADHPLFDAVVERLDVKRCIGGEYQWFTTIAFGLEGERLGGVRLGWELEGAGIGTVIDMPNWVGETRDSDGACRFFHTQQPCRYSLYAEGEWLVRNVRTDLPWKCYANGYCTYANVEEFLGGYGGVGGWLAVLMPGRFAYWITLKLKAK